MCAPPARRRAAADGGAVVKKTPFMLSEQGWGEFDMELVLHAIDKGGDHVIRHDLNFQKNKYESVHPLVGPPPRVPTSARAR